MDSFTCIFLVFMLCFSAVGSRPHLSSNNVRTRASLTDAEGVCSAVVETQNYPCHEHKVTTQDGFILSLQNIPYGRSDKTAGERPPVLVQHGLFLDAISWLLSPPDQSLALILADEGFDVWLVSTRGTKYSRGHTSLSPDDDDYWFWTWDELAAYDLPATFQYIHDQTGQKLHYVGHSQGTLIALAALSDGQLVSMMRSAALLSPVAYLGKVTSPLARFAAENLLAEALHLLRINEFNPRGKAVIDLLMQVCKTKDIDCTNLLTSFTGENCCLNSSIVSVLLQHEPQPTSTKNMIHLSQMVREGMIRKFDYEDEKENMKHYGTPTPPLYEMTNISNDLPLFMAYGGADALSVTKDVKMLLDRLQGHKGDKLVVEYTEEYGHVDYVLAVDAKQVVYDPIIAFFRLQ
ncbi:Myzus persicae-induced lipase 1 [Perilla frutescens var. hirtella]|uniref:Lipase n=1 Tax=Perilla frutescens var. hirtella TaxID=608512 RepID=A0AAD4JLD1_PERFH|nr:Myzus persicae-induced lipase 1 [Perilla frutescens var. hirtella]KAH6835985.1 Myzus persicae-induced lipase 1 [Perilla frutescens var. hirtella]